VYFGISLAKCSLIPFKVREAHTLARKKQYLCGPLYNAPMAEQHDVTTTEPTATTTAQTGNGGVQLNLPQGTQDFFTRYRNFIYAGIGLVVIAVVGLYFYYEGQAETRNEAAERGLPTTEFFETQGDSIVNGLTDNLGRPSFQKLADDYDGTPTGTYAAFMAGSAFLEQGNYSQAIEYLERFPTGEDMPSVMVLSALAAAYEGQGDVAKAAALYQQAAEAQPNSQTSPALLLEAARCLEQQDDKAGALQLYTKVYKTYPRSAEAAESEKHVYRLGGSL
jgi:tetratricopeptide (TPR) repeat protein